MFCIIVALCLEVLNIVMVSYLKVISVKYPGSFYGSGPTQP